MTNRHYTKEDLYKARTQAYRHAAYVLRREAEVTRREADRLRSKNLEDGLPEITDEVLELEHLAECELCHADRIELLGEMP